MLTKFNYSLSQINYPDFLLKTRDKVNVYLSNFDQFLEEIAACGYKDKVLFVLDENLSSKVSWVHKKLQQLSSKICLLKGRALCSEGNCEAIICEIKSKNPGLIVGIGCGSISDLCKAASFEAALPYWFYATAPSMNGFVSSSASIIRNEQEEQKCGHKAGITKSLPSRLFIDNSEDFAAKDQEYEVLKLGGVADTLCVLLAKNEILLMQAMLNAGLWVPANKEQLSEMVKISEALEQGWLSEASAEPSSSQNSCTASALYSPLLFVGFAMTHFSGSVVASGSEHQLAHYFAKKSQHFSRLYHGEQVAICGVLAAEIQLQVMNAMCEAVHEVTTPDGSASRLQSGHFKATLAADRWPKGIKVLTESEISGLFPNLSTAECLQIERCTKEAATFTSSNTSNTNYNYLIRNININNIKIIHQLFIEIVEQMKLAHTLNEMRATLLPKAIKEAKFMRARPCFLCLLG